MFVPGEVTEVPDAIAFGVPAVVADPENGVASCSARMGLVEQHPDWFTVADGSTPPVVAPVVEDAAPVEVPASTENGE